MKLRSIQNEKYIINLEYSELAKQKLGKFYEFIKNCDCDSKKQRTFFDSVKVDQNFQKRNDLKADFSIINLTFLRQKQNFHGNGKQKLIKFLVKILSQTVGISDTIFIMINKEISLMDLPEVFEKTFNGCSNL